MYQGTVKYVDNKKGYAFITQNNGGPDLSVEYSGINSNEYKLLSDGDLVEYALGVGHKGQCAINVTKI